MRIKAACKDAWALTQSVNRYVDVPAGGPPGSPTRLKAAERTLWDVTPESVQRRADKKQEALVVLLERNATQPTGAYPVCTVLLVFSIRPSPPTCLSISLFSFVSSLLRSPSGLRRRSRSQRRCR